MLKDTAVAPERRNEDTDSISVSSGVTAPKNHTVVSLFSGCGGMDLGFVGGFRFGRRTYKRLPFDITWANELDVAACDTYRLNISPDIQCGDIWESMHNLPKYADVVIGGFPCQDVSINGAMAAEKGERSTLYKAMQQVIQRIKPRIFVAENVKGVLMSHSDNFRQEMLARFDELGYLVSTHLYMAANYGVPQLRERVMFVGTRKGQRPFEHPPARTTPANWITAQKALSDLEHMPECRDTAHIWSKAKPTADQGSRRLVAYKPSTTIRAECHGNIQFHYSLDRRLSMREAARLQSFPDKFQFPAGIRSTERQIGNAVPPVLAWHVACAVHEYLK